MEILGLLDALESMILDGFKIPLTSKSVVNEEDLLNLIDKIRLVAQGGGDFAKKVISGGAHEAPAATVERVRKKAEKVEGEGRDEQEGKAIEVLQQAYQIAKEIRTGADGYADEVLLNLEATTARILRSVRAGRERLEKYQGEGGKQPESIEEILPEKKAPKEKPQKGQKNK